MLVSGLPYKFATPWAADESSGNITNPIPPTATGGAASQQQGFPLITATPVGAGGIPPAFADFNGFGFYVTAWLQWLQAGGPVFYDATFSSDIGGYPAGAIIRSATFGQFWLSTADSNTSDPDMGGANWVSAYSGRLLNVQTFTGAGAHSYTPTPGMRLLIIYAQGGGGAGAGGGSAGSGNVSLGAPGCSGSYAVGQYNSGAVGAGLTITVGAGGAAVSGGAGGNGGTTSAGTLVSCPGGPGGSTLTNQVPPTTNGNGSASSFPSGGNILGSVGSCNSPTLALTNLTGFGGAGGASVFGPGGFSVNPNITGPSAINYGSGGAGVMVNASGGTIAGGSGQSGIVIIYEYS